jgi:hypothetical protein
LEREENGGEKPGKGGIHLGMNYLVLNEAKQNE